jgi:hypothetical protein
MYKASPGKLSDRKAIVAYIRSHLKQILSEATIANPSIRIYGKEICFYNRAEQGELVLKTVEQLEDEMVNTVPRKVIFQNTLCLQASILKHWQLCSDSDRFNAAAAERYMKGCKTLANTSRVFYAWTQLNKSLTSKIEKSLLSVVATLDGAFGQSNMCTTMARWIHHKPSQTHEQVSSTTTAESTLVSGPSGSDVSTSQGAKQTSPESSSERRSPLHQERDDDDDDDDVSETSNKRMLESEESDEEDVEYRENGKLKRKQQRFEYSHCKYVIVKDLH